MSEGFVIKGTDFKKLGEKKVGKVRDIYVQDKQLIIVTTDRHSSFDRIIAHIPHKGAVLNQASLFWFEKTKDIVPNHSLGSPDPNVVLAKKCSVIPVEMVVRGFITGVTGTSLWTSYSEGKRDFGDFTLPDGLVKNQKLEEAVVTPTTKSDDHDRNLTSAEILKEGLMEARRWDYVRKVSLRLFARGQEIALRSGYILVDTKYEFGIDEEGIITLIDEIHTPDSSRYWKASSYEERIAQGLEPENFDKEFLRLWFKDNCDPYSDAEIPEAPKELVAELSRRYIDIFETLTGQTFVLSEGDVLERIENNLKPYTLT